MRPPKGAQLFRPAWWCRGPHGQTLAGALLRRRIRLPDLRREPWETPDGDFLEVDQLPGGADGPILVILHGLEGSSSTPQVRGFLAGANRRGWRALAVNFRSCGGRTNRLRRSYHGGDTADLHWILQRSVASHPHTTIFCLGLSLGGNVLLKYLGEQANAALPAVKAAAAICAPFDLAASAAAFEADFWNRVYMRRLVRSLKRKTCAKLRSFPDLVDAQRLEKVRTIRDFDALVTAPANGFPSADAYWSASSCAPFLPLIRRPVLLINALDDPLVPAHTLPRAAVAANPQLAPLFPRHGGHLGFIAGRFPTRPVFWAEEAIFDFFTRTPGA